MVLPPTRSESLRQISIVIDSLDRATADELLQHLSPDEQRAIRDQVVELQHVSPAEKQLVTTAFCESLRRGATALTEAVASPNLSQPSHVARELRNVLPASPPSSVRPLHAAVQSASLDALSKFLRDEHPQMVALVVSALPAERAAEFIAHWQPGSQAELLKRIADLQQADEGMIEEIQKELSERLAHFGTEKTRQQEGVSLVRSIMAAANGALRGELMDRLVAFDKDLALCVADVERPPATADVDPHEIAVAFDRFVDLDAELLTQVFEELDHDIAVLALAGASQPCLADILQRLPAETAAQLQVGLAGIGAIRLSDIYEAQRTAVQVGRHLSELAHVTQTQLKLIA